MAEHATDDQDKKSGGELLDFWATWCGPCKIMEPVLKELETEFGDKITIREIDVDAPEHAEIVEQYQVMSVPTYIFLKDGEVVDHAIGVQSKESMVQRVKKTLSESE